MMISHKQRETARPRLPHKDNKGLKKMTLQLHSDMLSQCMTDPLVLNHLVRSMPRPRRNQVRVTTRKKKPNAQLTKQLSTRKSQ
jgi:hypothetical protein